MTNTRTQRLDPAARPGGTDPLCTAVLNALPEHLAVIDRDGTIVRVNAAWTRYGLRNGGDPARIGVGTNYLDVCRRAKGRWSEGAAECLEGLQAVLSGERDRFELEYPCPSPDVARWFLLEAVPLEGAEGAVVTHTDVTALHQREEALRRQQARYRRLVDSNIVGVITATMTGEIREANDAFLHMLGYTRDDLIAGRVRWDTLTPPEYLPRAEQAVRELRATGVATPWETEWVARDGRRVPTLVGVALLPDEPEELTVAFVLDLTERRRAEEARQQQLAQVQRIYELTNAVSRATDMQQIYAEALDALRDTVHVDGAALMLWDENGVLSCRASVGLSERFQEATACRSPWSRHDREPKPVLVRDIREHPEMAYVREAAGPDAAGSLAFIPLVYRGKLVGQLLLHRREPGGFDLEAVRLAETVAEHVAFAIGRQQAEDQLRASEERFRTLSISAPIAIFELDREGRCTYVNQRWSEITGFPGEHGLGIGWLETVHPADRDRVQGAWNRAIREGTEGEGEVRLQTPFGERWVYARVAPVRNPEGRILSFVGTLEDITDQRRAREEDRFLARAGEVLAASLDLNQVLREVADLAVPFLADIALVLEMGEDGWPCRLAAATADPAKRGLLLALRAHWAAFLCLARGPWRALRSGRLQLHRSVSTAWWRPVVRTSWQLRLAQRLGVRSVLAVPLIARGRTCGLILLMQAESGRAYGGEDVHLAHELGRRAALAMDNAHLLQEAQEANRAKDQFLAVLSHELRNPLTPILAGVEILRRAAPEEATVQRTVIIVERNAKLQARLVNDLLDLSRIRQGKIQLQRAPIALDSVVQAAVQAQQADAEEAGLALETHLEPGLWVFGDADRLQQVVMNLLSNAIKFTPRGGRISVTLARHDTDKARIVVADTGVGISREMLPRLFRMFEQGEVAGKRTPGLGIGLALVKSITELHGGQVWAESAGPGKGSRFTVELPLTAAPAKEGGGPPPASEEGVRLLLVVDNPDTRALIAEGLGSQGYQVEAAVTAEEALEAMAHHPPDVILSDVALPGMSGFDLLERAHAMPQLASVPAFAISGDGGSDDARRVQEAGFSGHFVKPVDIAVVAQRIREYLRAHPPA